MVKLIRKLFPLGLLVSTIITAGQLPVLLQTADDGLPLLPGGGAGHHPLQRPRPVPLILQLTHGTK